MLTDYLALGENEIWNHARLSAYLANVGSPFATGPDICACETLTPAMITGGLASAYTTPATDPAPWYDADLPVSGEFLGLLVTGVEGIDGSTRTRNVTNAVGGGGVFGPSRDLPRVMTVTGVLIGSSCCGADYGLHWLGEALEGCSGSACGGDCATLYDCCPAVGQTPAQFQKEHRRTFVRTAVVSGPTVTARRGNGSCALGACSGGDLIEVEFILTAASPQAWADPDGKLQVTLPIGGQGDCIEWCTTNCTDCANRDCSAEGASCADPLFAVPAPPEPALPAAGFCVPLGVQSACYSVDLTDRPSWSSDVPFVQIRAGSQALRNVRFVIYAKPDRLAALNCDEVAANQYCSPVNEFYVTYIPAMGTVTFDGRTGFATVDCNGVCESAANAYGDQNGGPVVFNDLDCANYCVCIETDTQLPPAADAELTFSVIGRGY